MVNHGQLSMKEVDTWIKISYTDPGENNDLVDWCDNYVGGRYALGWTGIWFNNESDAMMFTLKWIK